MSAELLDALVFEGEEAAGSLQEMMAEMLGNVEQGGGYVRSELDEYTIRKMMLAREYNKKDIEKMKAMKSAIMRDWDRRINKKNEDIAAIDSIVDNFVRNDNKGKKLSLDIGTAYLQKKPHKIKVENEDEVRQHFAEQNMLEKFIKPGPLDTGLSEKYYMNEFEEIVSSIVELEVDREKQLSESKKVTKKREKEIREEVIERELPKFKEKLPNGFALTMPTESLTIRSNIK